MSIRLLLTSSNYKLCIGTAAAIEVFYLSGIYCTEFLFFWCVAGMFVFTLHEYLSHRFILHYAHDTQLYHYLHGAHHLNPFGKSIHIPILYSSFIHVLYFCILMRNGYAAAFSAMAVYQICYIIFEHIHMESHHPKWLLEHDMFRVSHMYHHTQNKYMAFSFSVPTWDILFGTFPYDALNYNAIALIPVPVLSYYYGTSIKKRRV